MRKAQKTQIEETFSLMEKAHEEIRKWLAQGNRENVLQLLGDCQDGAIQSGSLIEQTEGGDSPAVSAIEAYCETCWQIYEKTDRGEEQSPSGVHRLLQKMLAVAASSVRLSVPVRLEIAFFCHKASMSDSLESIYFAAKSDPSCDAYFIPIPYYDRYPDGTFGERHYEAEGYYPDSYDLVDWKSYDVETRRPDIIYIMNPYDNINRVTSVHPDFYASRLRNLTDCLVYMPYHVYKENVSAGSGSAPGALFSDLMFVPSEHVRDQQIERLLTANEIEGLTLRIAREKIIAMGSPKIDKLVRTGKEDYPLPEEWRGAVGSDDPGHKTVLYSLSISAALSTEQGGGEKYLKKIRSTFEFFRDRDDATLWLRPHPLLAQTFRSMRPQLADEYEEIIRGYRSEGWGIYDDTPDLNRAIAWCDVCYGDDGSLGQMFQFLGKPTLIQNTGNAGIEPQEAADAGVVKDAMDIFVSKDGYNSYIMYEAKDRTEEDRFSRADFFRHINVILEYSSIQMEKYRSIYTNADGTAGEKIHEYTTALLRRSRNE